MIGATWPNSIHVRVPGFKTLYVRRQPESFWPRWGQLTIANIEVLRPGTGTLTRILPYWEEQWSVSFENVYDPRFQRFLLNRAYQPILGVMPSFKREKAS